MIGIYPAYDSEQNFVGWEVWEGSTPYQSGLSIEAAGEVARKLTIKRNFEDRLKGTGATVTKSQTTQRGIFLSKEHDGKWEVWEDGKCVSVAYDKIKEASENFDQNNLDTTYKP